MPSSRLKPDATAILIAKLEFGGAQRVAIDQARLLSVHGFPVVLITGRDGLLLPDVRLLQSEHLRVHVLRPLRREIHPVWDGWCLLSLSRFLRVNRIGVLYTHGSKAGILGRLSGKQAGVPSIVHIVHGWSFHAGLSRAAYGLFRLMERIAAKDTVGIDTVSAADARLGERYRILPRSRIQPIHCGIGGAPFLEVPPLETRRRSPWTVGTVACFKPQKRPDRFLEMAKLLGALLPDIRFAMVGDGILRASCEKEATSAGLGSRFSFPGWSRDVAKTLASFDCFVLTSDWEGLPLAVLEAMAAARPVVISDLPGNREAVTHGAEGFLVNRLEPFAFARKVLSLYEDPCFARGMGLRGRERVKSHFPRSRYENWFLDRHRRLLTRRV